VTELNEHSDSLVPRIRQADAVRAGTLVNLARDAEQRGDVVRSLRYYDDALALLADETDLPLLADALRWKGTLHREQGETELAYRYYKQSLVHAETCSSIAGKAHAYNCLAIIAQRRGNLSECERLYVQASELAVDVAEVRLLGMIEQNRGVLLNMLGDLPAAEARYASSLASFESAKDDEAVSWVLNNIGMLYTKLGHYQRATEIFERALAIAKARNDKLVESILILNLAEVWVAIGKLDQAEDACRKSLESASGRGDHLTVAGALKCRARIERERGAYDASIATLRIAIFEAESLEDRLLQAELLREFGQTSRALGNSDEARLAWIEAAESFEDVGARQEASEINALLASLPR
jgi:tetratricopeptide (TPR) repeat protein